MQMACQNNPFNYDVFYEESINFKSIFIESQPDLTFLEPEGYSSRKGYLLQDSGGQFHKTFTSVIYKCSFWSVAIAFGP